MGLIHCNKYFYYTTGMLHYYLDDARAPLAKHIWGRKSGYFFHIYFCVVFFPICRVTIFENNWNASSFFSYKISDKNAINCKVYSYRSFLSGTRFTWFVILHKADFANSMIFHCISHGFASLFSYTCIYTAPRTSLTLKNWARICEWYITKGKSEKEELSNSQFFSLY